MKYKHLFFDLDQTIAPSREPILPEMYKLLDETPHDIIIVSGQALHDIAWQSDNLPAITMGQCGNHATDVANKELWREELSESHKQEIFEHVAKLKELLDEEPNEDWAPLEDRGALVCFSPIGNRAPVEVKRAYDPDSSKRNDLLDKIPFVSAEVSVKIGGSTSFDYLHKDLHKGYNVAKLIDYMGWNKEEAVYFGDRLHPGGNDESVIGVIDTIAVEDHLDTYKKLQEMLK
ncbi:MAG: HAD-IIB family hydrolase [Patescibacteria group bacterium]